MLQSTFIEITNKRDKRVEFDSYLFETISKKL